MTWVCDFIRVFIFHGNKIFRGGTVKIIKLIGIWKLNFLNNWCDFVSVDYNFLKFLVENNFFILMKINKLDNEQELANKIFVLSHK